MRTRHGTRRDAESLWVRLLRWNLQLVLFLVLAVAGMIAVYWFFSPADSSVEALAVDAAGGGLSAPLHKAIPDRPISQRLSQSPGPTRIGIIIGHQNSDSGAVCDDGLTEVEVNAQLAKQVQAQLNARGVHTDLLDEFDPRLTNYHATALISIHADSCVYFNELATGFKIAGSSYTDSSSLSICVEQAYRDATNMFYHENTITPHMTDYHAFREISPGVQAIIIETGFMYLDREMLTDRAEVPAAGIVQGITCFLGQ